MLSELDKGKWNWNGVPMLLSVTNFLCLTTDSTRWVQTTDYGFPPDLSFNLKRKCLKIEMYVSTSHCVCVESCDPQVCLNGLSRRTVQSHSRRFSSKTALCEVACEGENRQFDLLKDSSVSAQYLVWGFCLVEKYWWIWMCAPPSHPAPPTHTHSHQKKQPHLSFETEKGKDVCVCVSEMS